MSMMPSVPTPGRREIEGGGEPEPASADAEHLGVEELRLTDLADLGQQEVPAVAVCCSAVNCGPPDGQDPGSSSPVPATHRDDVLVAQLLQDAAGEHRARAARAVRDDRAVLVGHRLLDAHLEEAARHGTRRPGR
jgi:hypothetical protein